VRRAQHFDAFLALPGYGARYVPMLPYVHAALDQIGAHLDGLAGPPADAVIEAVPRGTRQVQAGDFKFPAARARSLA
jgi:hydroxybutyrate-dimer hydrolase